MYVCIRTYNSDMEYCLFKVPHMFVWIESRIVDLNSRSAILCSMIGGEALHEMNSNNIVANLLSPLISRTFFHAVRIASRVPDLYGLYGWNKIWKILQWKVFHMRTLFDIYESHLFCCPLYAHKLILLCFPLFVEIRAGMNILPVHWILFSIGTSVGETEPWTVYIVTYFLIRNTNPIICKSAVMRPLFGWYAVVEYESTKKRSLSNLFVCDDAVCIFLSRYIFMYLICKHNKNCIRKYEKCFSTTKYQPRIVVTINENLHTEQNNSTPFRMEMVRHHCIVYATRLSRTDAKCWLCPMTMTTWCETILINLVIVLTIVMKYIPSSWICNKLESA